MKKGNLYTLKAPAKINIGLRILSKRKDGYHNIETIYYPIKLYDILKIKIQKSKNKLNIGVSTGTKNSIKGKNNICYKAVKLFLDGIKLKDNYIFEINIKKNIPIGAGLGGGSSDAAAVLIFLSKYFKAYLRKRREVNLEKIALKLGSDVPYFLNYELPKGKRNSDYEFLIPAYATSRGEKLVYFPKFKIKYRILIVYPGIKISTKWAYKKFKVQSSRFKVLNKEKKFSVGKLELFRNDFEEVVFGRYPKIGKIKNKMYEFRAVFSSMSGSGSAVYGLFRKLDDLKRAGKFFRELGYKVFKER